MSTASLILAGPLELSYPLSALQQGMLYHYLASEDRGVDVVQLVISLHEAIDQAAFKQAWEQVAARHAVLRTAFRWENGGDPEQFVQAGIELPWRDCDWAHVPPPGRKHELGSFLEDDRRRGFQIDCAPLWRLTLVKWQDDEFTLVWTFHHAVLDGRSFLAVVREAFVLYDGAKRKEVPALPDPIPYGDYLQWLVRQDFSRSEAFWRSLLAGVTAPTSLPADWEGRPKRNNSLEKKDWEIALSGELTGRLRDFAKNNGLTLNILMQAAWALLLSRHGGEEDVLFGATRACRKSSVQGGESMVGLMINTLPVRVKVRGDAPVIPWLQDLRKLWVDMRSHEHSPLIKVHGCSEVPRNAALFESIVVFENFSIADALRKQGGAWSNREVQLLEKTNFPLTFAIHDGERLHLKLGYRTDRYSDEAVARMMGHLETLLESIIEPGSRRLGDLSMLTAAERNQILIEWNQTRKDYPGKSCIHELIERQAQRTPQKTALQFENSICTYAELNAKANQLARQLQVAGIERGHFVPLLFDAGIDLVIAELAVMKAGAAFVPLDSRWPESRIQAVLGDLAPLVMLVDKASTIDVKKLSLRVIHVSREGLAGSEENPASGVQLMDPIYLLFTSGSTGKPKGAINHHAGIVNRFFNMNDRFGCGEKDVILSTTAHVFDSSVWQYFWPLTNGARTVIPSSRASSDPQYLLDLMTAEKVTITDFVPALLAAVTDEMDQDASLSTRLGSLRHVLVGGEEINPEATYRFKAHLPGAGVTNAYGPTETSIGVIFYELPGEPVDCIPIGRPLRNVQAIILDQNLNLVPAGVPGDLYIGGICVGLGYLNNEEATRQAFIPNPFAELDSTTLYRTGDRARFLPDGNIVFLGRNDAQVKVRGFRIELGEIEAALRDCSGVRACAVLAREDEAGEKQLIAYVVPAEGQPALSREALRGSLKQRLPAYMIPAAFVVLETFPQTPSGKVDRKALPQPDAGASAEENEFVAPRTPDEIALAEIWKRVLGSKQVGINDDFFDLGGHSIRAVRLISEIKKSFGCHLTIPIFFQNPTIRQLATILEHERRSHGAHQDKSPLIAFQAKGTRPPFFFLHGDWIGGGLYCGHLSKQMGEDQPLYALPPYRAGKEQVLTLPEMVAYHLAVIREHTPHGPYLLGGFCVGATIAVEVARQMVQEGEEVSHLFLLDPPPRNLPFLRQFWRLVDAGGDLSKWDLLKKIHFFDHYRSAFVRALAMSHRDKFRAVARRLRFAGPGPRATSAVEVGEDDREIIDSLDFKVYGLAYCLHIARSVSVPTTVYIPEETSASWSSMVELAKGISSNCSVEKVPGDHYSCIKKYAPVLADWMAMTLRGL